MPIGGGSVSGLTRCCGVVQGSDLDETNENALSTIFMKNQTTTILPVVYMMLTLCSTCLSQELLSLGSQTTTTFFYRTGVLMRISETPLTKFLYPIYHTKRKTTRGVLAGLSLPPPLLDLPLSVWPTKTCFHTLLTCDVETSMLAYEPLLLCGRKYYSPWLCLLHSDLHQSFGVFFLQENLFFRACGLGHASQHPLSASSNIQLLPSLVYDVGASAQENNSCRSEDQENAI